MANLHDTVTALLNQCNGTTGHDVEALFITISTLVQRPGSGLSVCAMIHVMIMSASRELEVSPEDLIAHILGDHMGVDVGQKPGSCVN